MKQVIVDGKSLARCNFESDEYPGYSRLRLKPYMHQLKSYQILMSDERRGKVLFNTCGTGLGKTYSVAVPLLDRKEAYSVFIYPTNALIEDQYLTLHKLVQRMNIDSRVLFKATAQDLVRLSEKKHMDRRELLEDFLSATYSDLRLLVTNPDLFYIMLGLRFSKRYALKIAVPLAQRFNNVIFDEFHLYNWKQLSNILFFMKFMSTFSERPPNFIFLSATPNDEFIKEVKRLFSDFSVEIVHENEKSNCDGETYPIIADTTLELHKYDDVVSWFETNLTYIRKIVEEKIDVLKEESESKIVIILNSVYKAQLVKELLEEKLKDLPIAIGAWHGMNRYTRMVEKESNIIVGTSAIEVGIDFKALVLIFEADNASSFIQRFGRVGRIATKPEWGNLEFKAIALLPGYAYNYISRMIGNRARISRNDLTKIVYDAFEERTKFRKFKDTYAPIEHYSISVGYANSIGNLNEKEEFMNIMKKNLLELHPNANFNEIYESYNRFSEVEGLLDELHQFRGGLFDVPLFDMLSLERGQFPLNIYDLFYCIRHFDFSVITRHKFNELLGRVDRESDAFRMFEFELNQILRYDRSVPFLLVHSRSPKSLAIQIHNENDLVSEKVDIIDGFKIYPNKKVYNPDKNLALSKINDWLSSKRLVYFLIDEDPHVLRNKLKLSPYFPIYHFKGYTIYGDIIGSIAFGLNAFLLSSELTNKMG